MAVERTLSIIKPDAVAKNVIGRIYARFEDAGLKIVAARMTWLSQAEAEGFYAVHRERPFFRDLVKFMTSGPVMVQVLEGESAIAKNRDLMGATDPKKAAAGTIRADFAQSIDANAVHGSDGPDTARFEVGYFPGTRSIHGSETREVGLPPPRNIMINLLDLEPAALARFFEARGEKPFRARQVSRWVHQRFAPDVAHMTDLARPLRERLATESEIRALAVIRDTTATDGTRKWLLDTGNGNAVEAVYIPEDDRGTLCISSQAGCALDCAFCATGKQGFNRNLTTAEIVGQLWHANRTLLADGVTGPWVEAGRAPITNVVMMGMGEPLANYDRVVPALRLFLDDNAYGLSRRRVTLSTSGLVPWIDRLRDDCPVALAVSLHAPTDALRDRLVPINRTYPLAELLAACRRYLARAPRDFITFEYVMLDRVNDQPEHAKALAALLADVPCKLNLIPFNPFAGTEFRVSPRTRIVAFQRALIDAGYVATIRKTRGDDIDAACGQLAGRVQDRTRRRLGTRIAIAPAR